MEASKLKEILGQHQLWIDGKGGSCADLTGVNLHRANLSDADLRGAILRDANLTYANLTGANLGGANLGGAYLGFANLNTTDLTGANLTDANLIGANLRGANLTGAYLLGANLTGANLAGAILRHISWVIPGCLAQLNEIKHGFYLAKDGKRDNFVQDSIGFFIQNNSEEKTFDILVGDRIIRGIPHWVKYSGMKQVAAARKEESHD
jgi:hypothetical protein